MEKKISSYEARRQFGRVIREVEQGDSIVVERHGEPVVAVVTLEMYELAQAEQRRRQAERFRAFLEKASANWAKQAPDMTDEEIMELALEATEWAREQRRTTE